MESLSCSCPVIITTSTPWKGLSAGHAGWDIPVEEEQIYQEVLQQCCSMNQEEYNEWQLGAYNRAVNYSSNEEILDESRRLFA